MDNTIKASIYVDNKNGYVAKCANLPITTQGKTLDESLHNLREAVVLYFEEKNLESPTLIEKSLVNSALEITLAVKLFPDAKSQKTFSQKCSRQLRINKAMRQASKDTRLKYLKQRYHL